MCYNYWMCSYDYCSSNYNANSADASNAISSGITPNDALGHVVQNFGRCQENAERLNALQKWIKDSKVNIETSNKKP